MKNIPLHLVGYASGLAAGLPGTGDGPLALSNSPHFSALAQAGIDANWFAMVKAKLAGDKFQNIVDGLHDLRDAVREAVKTGECFATIGGDHASGIGTWTGVKREIDGALGLIWVDAHMDAHTPETSPTGNIHGMPIASLLGYGYPELIATPPVLLPKNICLIGIRDYEDGEAALLNKLGVKIFYAEDVKRLGLEAVFEEAKRIAQDGTVAYGLSVDLDGLDPSHAPGVGTPVSGGLDANAFCEHLPMLLDDPRFIGFEITEFNPHLDVEYHTEKLVFELIKAVMRSLRQ